MNEVVSKQRRSRRFGKCVVLNLRGDKDKSCTWNCVYCPWREKRGSCNCETASSFPEAGALLDELTKRLKQCVALDSVILSGNSEPTVHPKFLDIVNGILRIKKDLKAEWLLQATTNGSKLDNDLVATACNLVDKTWIKIDCAEDGIYMRANRPLIRSDSISSHIKRLGRLRSPFIHTTLWRYPAHLEAQTWLPDNLIGLLSIYGELKPSAVHLTTTRISDRAISAEFQPVSYENLQGFALRISELGIPVEVFA